MILTNEMAPQFRCCGPPGCGDTVPANGGPTPTVRVCVGAECMAWQIRFTKYESPAGLVDIQDIGGKWAPVEFGTCGLAPDPGDDGLAAEDI